MGREGKRKVRKEEGENEGRKGGLRREKRNSKGRKDERSLI